MKGEIEMKVTMIASDREKLESAQQSVDLAQQAVATLYKAEDPLLAEHAFELLEQIAKMNQKLQRLLTVTKSN
jgi:hypothetical protein